MKITIRYLVRFTHKALNEDLKGTTNTGIPGYDLAREVCPECRTIPIGYALGELRPWALLSLWPTVPLRWLYETVRASCRVQRKCDSLGLLSAENAMTSGVLGAQNFVRIIKATNTGVWQPDGRAPWAAYPIFVAHHPTSGFHSQPHILPLNFFISWQLNVCWDGISHSV